MTDEKEIPADALARAEAVTKTMPTAFGWRKITVEVALAILAERERCAQIAEGLDRRGREWVPGSLWDKIKRDTAAAIRRGDP